MTTKRGDWMQTYLGGVFYPRDPRSNEVHIEDIAHALSLQCRYNGHTDVFYSVAEHCVLVSRAVDPENALAGLLHDAAEAYIGDLIRPIKRDFIDFLILEAKIERAIASKFRTTFPWPFQVHEVDTRILVDERNALMKAPPKPWFGGQNVDPLGIAIQAWDPDQAEFQFLERFRDLTGK